MTVKYNEFETRCRKVIEETLEFIDLQWDALDVEVTMNEQTNKEGKKQEVYMCNYKVGYKGASISAFFYFLYGDHLEQARQAIAFAIGLATHPLGAVINDVISVYSMFQSNTQERDSPPEVMLRSEIARLYAISQNKEAQLKGFVFNHQTAAKVLFDSLNVQRNIDEFFSAVIKHDKILKLH